MLELAWDRERSPSELVSVRLDGNRRFYQVRAERIARLRSILDDFWGTRLAGLRAELANPEGDAGVDRGALIEGDAVVHELLVAVSAERLFDMFTDPVELVRWIGISADLEPRPNAPRLAIFWNKGRRTLPPDCCSLRRVDGSW